MSTSVYYHIHRGIRRYQVCATTTGLDHAPIAAAVFDHPRAAIAYIDMHDAAVTPLRAAPDDLAGVRMGATPRSRDGSGVARSGMAPVPLSPG